MAGTLVDSNVILDVLTEDARWYAWSSNALAQCANKGPLYINPIIYAEVSIGVATIEEMDASPRVIPPAPDPARSGVPGWESLPAIPKKEGIQNHALARLLHRRPRRGGRIATAHAG